MEAMWGGSHRFYYIGQPPSLLNICYTWAMTKEISPSRLGEYVGREVGVTDWVVVDQERINRFADATDDHQYIHTEPQRAAETRFGGTIAHGFLTLSLLSMFSGMGGSVQLAGTVMAINYGLNKVRFISPVKVGQRIRARFTLLEFDEKKAKHFLLKYGVTIDIEGGDKPALIAEWLGMTVTE